MQRNTYDYIYQFVAQERTHESGQIGCIGSVAHYSSLVKNPQWMSLNLYKSFTHAQIFANRRILTELFPFFCKLHRF